MSKKSITPQEVEHVGHLARISLTTEEVQSLTKDLEQILGYVTKLNDLNVETIEPTSHVLPVKNVFREDSIKPSFKQSESTQFAVEHANGSFKVPKVIE